jgi:hypothetical protein
MDKLAEDAIKYFDKEIEYFDLSLTGLMYPEYTEYMKNKREFYTLALSLITKTFS